MYNACFTVQNQDSEELQFREMGDLKSYKFDLTKEIWYHLGYI